MLSLLCFFISLSATFDEQATLQMQQVHSIRKKCAKIELLVKDKSSHKKHVKGKCFYFCNATMVYSNNTLVYIKSHGASWAGGSYFEFFFSQGNCIYLRENTYEFEAIKSIRDTAKSIYDGYNNKVSFPCNVHGFYFVNNKMIYQTKLKTNVRCEDDYMLEEVDILSLIKGTVNEIAENEAK